MFSLLSTQVPVLGVDVGGEVRGMRTLIDI